MRDQGASIGHWSVALALALAWAGCVMQQAPSVEVPSPHSESILNLTRSASFDLPPGLSWIAVPFRVDPNQQQDGSGFSYRIEPEDESATRALLIAEVEEGNISHGEIRVGNFSEGGLYTLAGTRPTEYLLIFAVEDTTKPTRLLFGFVKRSEEPLVEAEPVLPAASGSGARIAFYREQSNAGHREASSHGVNVKDDRQRLLPSLDAVSAGGSLALTVNHDTGALGFHYWHAWVGVSGDGVRQGDVTLKGDIGGEPFAQTVPWAGWAGARGFHVQGTAERVNVTLDFATRVEVQPETRIDMLSIPWNPEDFGLRMESGIFGFQGFVP